MNKLQAVQKILRSNGLQPRNQLDTTGASDMADAERILDEVELEIQARGWHYNTRKKVQLSPGTGDRIEIPEGVIAIDTDYTSSSVNVTQQGQFLYDLDNNRDTFTDSVYVSYLIRFEWDCIPYPIREYIAAEAALRYHNARVKRSGATVNFRQGLYDWLNRAEAQAKQFETTASDESILDTPLLRRVRGRSNHSIFYQG